MTATLPGMTSVRLLIFLVQLELIEELLDGAGGELAGGPCRQDGHAGGVGDEQVDRHIGALDLAGDEEVGQGEVDGQHAGIVGVAPFIG